MNEELIQKISMLVDGELGVAESSKLIDKILEENELREVWLRYHAAGTLLKSDSGETISSQFSEKIRCAIQAEPTVLAPIQTKTKAITTRQTAFGAIAASVLVFAFMIGSSPELPTKTPASSVEIASSQPTSSLPNEVVATSSVMVVKNQDEEVWIQDERLNNYLLKHNEASQSGGVFSVLPYARVVSYGSGR